MLNGIWYKFMDLSFTRRQDARKTIAKYPGPLSTDFALEVLKESSKFAQYRQISCQDDLHGFVLSYSNSRYFVDLAAHTCSCGRFQVNGTRCRHATALIHWLRGHPRDYIPEVFDLETYRRTYSQNMVPVEINTIGAQALSEICLPPTCYKGPKAGGRPKEQWVRKAERRRNDTCVG